MERTEYLWPGGPLFFYDDALFPPSTDSFLLSDFAAPRSGFRVCDLGSGIGLLGTLLLARQETLEIVNVELQPEGCALAARSAAVNGFADRVTCLCADLRDASQLPEANSFDLVITNPPYFPAERGIAAVGTRGSARSELTASLEEVLHAAARLLKFGGRLALVFRAERMAELFETARKLHLEPKRMRLIQHRADTAPSLLLLECRKGGRPGLTVEPVLLMETADGESADVRRAYFRDKEATL